MSTKYTLFLTLVFLTILLSFYLHLTRNLALGVSPGRQGVGFEWTSYKVGKWIYPSNGGTPTDIRETTRKRIRFTYAPGKAIQLEWDGGVRRVRVRTEPRKPRKSNEVNEFLRPRFKDYLYDGIPEVKSSPGMGSA